MSQHPPYWTQRYPGPNPVYVDRSTNGLAIAGLVLGYLHIALYLFVIVLFAGGAFAVFSSS